MKSGKVKWYNPKKRFGFIVDDSGKDIFVHFSDITAGTELQDGDLVEFEVGQGPRGEKAVEVRKL